MKRITKVMKNKSDRMLVYSYKCRIGFYFDRVEVGPRLKLNSEVYYLELKYYLEFKFNESVIYRTEDLIEDVADALFLKLIDQISVGARIFDLDYYINEVKTLLNVGSEEI